MIVKATLRVKWSRNIQKADQTDIDPPWAVSHLKAHLRRLLEFGYDDRLGGTLTVEDIEVFEEKNEP